MLHIVKNSAIPMVTVIIGLIAITVIGTNAVYSQQSYAGMLKDSPVESKAPTADPVQKTNIQKNIPDHTTSTLLTDICSGVSLMATYSNPQITFSCSCKAKVKVYTLNYTCDGWCWYELEGTSNGFYAQDWWQCDTYYEKEYCIEPGNYTFTISVSNGCEVVIEYEEAC